MLGRSQGAREKGPTPEQPQCSVEESFLGVYSIWVWVHGKGLGFRVYDRNIYFGVFIPVMVT